MGSEMCIRDRCVCELGDSADVVVRRDGRRNPFNPGRACSLLALILDVNSHTSAHLALDPRVVKARAGQRRSTTATSARSAWLLATPARSVGAGRRQGQGCSTLGVSANAVSLNAIIEVTSSSVIHACFSGNRGARALRGGPPRHRDFGDLRRRLHYWAWSSSSSTRELVRYRMSVGI